MLASKAHIRRVKPTNAGHIFPISNKEGKKEIPQLLLPAFKYVAFINIQAATFKSPRSSTFLMDWSRALVIFSSTHSASTAIRK